MGLTKFFSSISDLLNFPLFSLPEHNISLRSLFLLIALLWAFTRVSKWAEKLTHRALLYKDIDPGVKGSVERFVRYIILGIGFYISFSTIGINLNSLAAVGAVGLIAIGLGLQNITQNFISGFILLMERPIKKGDIVQVGKTSGRILEIQARSTLILTRDDVVIVVPNSQFITEQVVNDSFSGDKLRLTINTRVAYGTDLEKVSALLIQIAQAHPKVLQSPPSSVLLKDFGESALELQLRVWTAELWFADDLLSDLRYQIVQQFHTHNISIPFPQRELHFKTGNLALREQANSVFEKAEKNT